MRFAPGRDSSLRPSPLQALRQSQATNHDDIRDEWGHGAAVHSEIVGAKLVSEIGQTEKSALRAIVFRSFAES
jgi:hypothetical protein